jgi:hypothetical protein
MEAEMKFHACICGPMSFDWCSIDRSPPNPGSLFYVLRYPNRQRESKCVLAQGALSLYRSQNLIRSTAIYQPTVALIKRASRNKSICLQTLKVGANDRSAQELQNGI